MHGTGDLSTTVGGITLDSRRVAPGDLYAALPGAHGHGATYWPQARDAGAVAVVTDGAGAAMLGEGVPALSSPRSGRCSAGSRPWCTPSRPPGCG